MITHHQVQLEPITHERHGISQAKSLIFNARPSHVDIAMKRTSIELNGLPLYVSTKSAASPGFASLTNAMDRLGEKSLHAQKICQIFSENWVEICCEPYYS